jgi:hypothetical protein
MSDRERWIVYPLLFLALGVALRNQFLPTRLFGALDVRAAELTAQRIRCNQLVVNEEADCKKVIKFQIAGGNYIKSGMSESMQSKTGLMECHALHVINKENKPLVTAGEDPNTRSGFIQTQDSRGRPLVQVRSTGTGGMVTAIGQGGKVCVGLGHEGQEFGVFAQFPQIGPPFLLTPPVQLQVKPAPTPSSPKTPPAQKPTEEKEKEKKDAS